MKFGKMPARARASRRAMLAVGMSLVYGVAFGHAGDMDGRFGSDGSLSISVEGSIPFGSQPAMATDSQRRLIAAAHATSGDVMTAVTKNGKVDSTFGTDGQVLPEGQVVDIGVDSKNRIDLLTMETVDGNWTTRVSRYLSDGALDESFGTSGTVVLADTDASMYPYQLAIADDDTIAVVGTRLADGEQHAYVAKITDAGNLDPTFASKGWSTFSFVTSGAEQTDGQAIAIDAEGEIVMAAYTSLASTSDVDDIAKILPNGTLDKSFGHGLGYVQLDEVTGTTDAHYTVTSRIAVDDDGNYVLGGGVGTWLPAWASAMVMRLTKDGDFDPSFAHGAPIIFNARSDVQTEANSIAIDGRGQIVAGGITRKNASSPIEGVVFRLNGDGSPDTRFGGHDGAVPLSNVGYGTRVVVTKRNEIAAIGVTDSTIVISELIGYGTAGTP